MRRSHIWFLIAVFWLADAVLAALRKHWSAAAPAAVVALIFFIVAVLYWRRDASLVRGRIR
jgi:hypothetical protein